MSSSTDIDVAKNFLKNNGKRVIFEIQNTKGIPIEQWSNLPEEKEVLLPRGKSYTVKSITKQEDYLYIVIQ